MNTTEWIAAAASTVAAAGAGLAAYAGLSDASQWFGRVLVAPPESDRIALTFDDGPNPAVTPMLLKLLEERRVKATFFLIGAHARLEPGLTREIAAAGHAIGNHTMHHPWLPRHGAALIREELESCSVTLEDILGQRVSLFRPPHGARRPMVLRAARELGLTTCQWNLIVGDWKPVGAREIARRVQAGIANHVNKERGTMVVLHDGSQHEVRADRTQTVEAVRIVLDQVREGMRFVRPALWD